MIFNPHKWGVHKVLRHVPLLHQLLELPYQRRLQKAINIADLRRLAQQRAHKMVFDYMDGGAEDEVTMRRNKSSFDDYEMHYHILNGIKPPLDLSTTLFGRPVKLPFFGCPAAGNKMFHVQGELAAAQAAVQHGTAYTLSSLSTTPLTDITQTIPPDTIPKVFQLYVWKDRALVKDLLQDVKRHDFDALALTVDVSWMGHRERDVRNGFSIPPNYSFQQVWQALQAPAWTYDFLRHEPYAYACINKDVPAESMVNFINSQLTPDFSWKDAEWLLGEWNSGGGSGNNNSNNKPMAIKGIIRPDDALRAKEMGFSSIWVSNHGGRQMEGAPATITVLPAIRDAVGPDMEIILDGGIERGTQIAKALALGADGVGVGRPYLWGLCAGGVHGVSKAYAILHQELDRAMGLLGTPTVADLKARGRDLVRQRSHANNTSST